MAFCRDVSLAAAEPAYGKALSAPAWLLLEYNGEWRARATEDNELPRKVQAWLEIQTAAVNGRLQFIKQKQDAEDETELSFFIIIPDAKRPRQYRFPFRRYEELLNIDVAAVAAEEKGAPQSYEELLYLVCTNGRRDRCCAKYGFPLYQELVDKVGTAVWETTHVGSHRFAPNIIAFPEGIYYSRLEIDELDDFIAARRRDEIYLSRYRGRTAYPKPVQAAEYFLRRETGDRTLYGWSYQERRKNGDDAWRVAFTAPDGTIHQVDLRVERDTPTGLDASCGKPLTKPTPHYELLGYTTPSSE
jgi:hypothetical protein